MILIFTTRPSNRLKYILDFIFKDVLRWDYTLIDNIDGYVAHDGPKLNYSEADLGVGIFFASSGLLHERGIENRDLSFIEYEGLPAFFPIHQTASAMPFDVFSASFYLLSRYEEYLPYVKDEYGRFQAKFSVAYQQGFLNKPIVDVWIRKLALIISENYNEFKIPDPVYKFIPTIDINAAYAYKAKGFVRSAAGFMMSLIDLNWKGFKKRSRVLLGMEKDPYNTYEQQLEIHNKYRLETIYFILFARYGTNDKNISFNNRRFQVLIKSLADYCDVGLHVSFSSISNPDLLSVEFSNLSEVLKREINKSRQHFLVLNIPSTYRNLLNLDIVEDYSMGYATTPGFRAGTSRPFNFYDLDVDAQTHLKLHPFVFMDTAFKHGSGMEEYRYIVKQVKKSGGNMVLLWNNESFSEKILGQNGIKTYEELVRIGLAKDN